MLMLPGPTDMPDESYSAMSSKIINHRDERFRILHREVIEQLKRLLYTSDEVFLLTCSSTGGLEAALANIIERDDRVLAIRYGQFCDRLAEAASFYSEHLVDVEIPWGSAPTLDNFKECMDSAGEVDVVLIVHNETSTGAFVPELAAIASECRKRGAYLVVDAVTSAGGVPLRFNELDVDLLVAGTQKCLAGPPGLSIIAIKNRAWDKIEEKRRRPLYFDLLMYREFMERDETPFTPAISLFYGLKSSLTKILQIGPERWFDNHRNGAEAFYEAFEAMGLKIYPAVEFRSPTLIALKTPSNLFDRNIARLMAAKFDVHVGVGVSKEKGRMLRIGNMGLVSAERTYSTIIALGESLKELGHDSDYKSAAEVVWKHFKN